MEGVTQRKTIDKYYIYNIGEKRNNVRAVRLNIFLESAIFSRYYTSSKKFVRILSYRNTASLIVKYGVNHSLQALKTEWPICVIFNFISAKVN